MGVRRIWGIAWSAGLAAISLLPVEAQSPALQEKAVFDKYCVVCHSDKARTGGLTLQHADLVHVPAGAETWEKVIRKLRVGAMPPQGMPQPAPDVRAGLAQFLETSLDHAYEANPNPGRALMHRLNRAEYANAIRDLLALKIDPAAYLPPDDESSGFDNIADVLKISPSLEERYLSASWNISRQAVGDARIAPRTAVYRVRPDLSQDRHIEGLPLGTRGGISVQHTFPLDGEYVIKVRLWRNTFDLMRGMEDPHRIEINLDDRRIAVLLIGGRPDLIRMAANPGAFGADVDRKLTVRVPIKAGVHTVSADTVLRSHAIKDDLVKPFLRTTVDGLDITGDPSVDRLSIEGPFNETGPGDTASRRRIFVCHPAGTADELPCARKILSMLARRAFRRPVTDADLETLLSFYQRRRNDGGNFEAGIESALQFILASPEFLYRIEPDPRGSAPNAAYRLSDLALASRLSFFLWSSIPDDELLKLAEQKKLHQPAVLEQQVRRMLADSKSDALISNFAEQWLFLRNLKNSAPDLAAFPDFDDNLRESMKKETELFFGSIIHEDRSVMDLLTADYTFLNERLARHYGIPDIYGSQFRRVHIDDPRRRGLLGQASILTITSYPARTSPVQRGKWILTNILGVPPQPPPPNVPALKENGNSKPLSLRQRMELHRANPVCAGCHKKMDPIGFALENFDAIGRWRASDDGAAIDPSGTLFEGTHVDGPVALTKMLASRPDVFVGVMTEKLLTYAVGRPLTYRDMPAVRKIVQDAKANGYRFSLLVNGVVDSPPFRMKLASAKAARSGAAQ
ncbi:MAG TPA: DUF1592 domain-containing protein [Bryobacteraceae bacterium]|nr:DUF1592 domain-containing protein [Bryobacteraceae bacterium]